MCCNLQLFASFVNCVVQIFHVFFGCSILCFFGKTVYEGFLILFLIALFASAVPGILLLPRFHFFESFSRDPLPVLGLSCSGTPPNSSTTSASPALDGGQRLRYLLVCFI